MHRPIGKLDLIAYADGELSGDRAEQVKAHLARHPDLQREVQSLRRLRASARKALRADPDAAASERLSAEVSRLFDAPADAAPSMANRPAHAGRLRARPWALAAGVAISLATVAGYVTLSSSPGRSGPAAGVSGPAVSPLAVTITRKHVTCAQMKDHFYDKRFPTVVSEVPAVASGYLGTEVALADLSGMGLRFAGAGGCLIPGGKTVHLLYRSEREPERVMSLFVQAYNNQPGLEVGKLLVLQGPDAGHQLLAWRGEKLVFYLVAGDASDAERASQLLGAPRL